MLAVLFSGCATSKVAEGELLAEQSDPVLVEDEVDPYEGFNRSMYGFNDILDTYFSSPIIDTYKWVTPTLIQTGVSNIFSNMREINVVLNDLLQGKIQQGAEDTGRFLLNSTIGIGGLFDVGIYLGLEKHEEDFGQTLAVWGVPSGPYLVLPVLGPSTFRGMPAGAVDTLANPVTYLAWPVGVLAVIDKRATADGALKFIDEAAVDPYIFTRESYLQWRNYLATDGNQPLTDDLLADFDEEFFEDEEEGSDTEQTINYQVNLEAIQDAQTQGVSTEKKDQKFESGKNNTSGTEPVNTEPTIQQPDENERRFEAASEAFDRAKLEYYDATQELESLKSPGYKYNQ